MVMGHLYFFRREEVYVNMTDNNKELLIAIEHLLIEIIKVENDHLMRRIYGCLKKELDILQKKLEKGEKRIV